MTQSVAVNGSIVVGSGLCTPSTGGVDQCVRQLVLGHCGAGQGLTYESTVVTQISVSTAGSVGDEFAALDVLSQFTAIEFLFLQSSARIRLQFTLPGGGTTTSPDIEGLQIYQFARSPNAPSAIEASGVATLDIIAAGRASA